MDRCSAEQWQVYRFSSEDYGEWCYWGWFTHGNTSFNCQYLPGGIMLQSYRAYFPHIFRIIWASSDLVYWKGVWSWVPLSVSLCNLLFHFSFGGPLKNPQRRQCADEDPRANRRPEWGSEIGKRRRSHYFEGNWWYRVKREHKTGQVLPAQQEMAHWNRGNSWLGIRQCQPIRIQWGNARSAYVGKRGWLRLIHNCNLAKKLI